MALDRRSHPGRLLEGWHLRNSARADPVLGTVRKMSAPFVGRADELAAIERVADAVLGAGGAGVVAVRGEPGSGKSRLLDEAVRASPLRRHLRVSGYEPEAQVPLAAAGPFLRALARAGREGARLDELVFGAGTEGLEPLQVFEAAHRAMRGVSTLVAVDDLQWVDERSRALLHYLVRAADAPTERLVVVIATRAEPGALAAAAALAAIATVSAERQLGGLPEDEGVALLRQLDRDLSRERAVTLWQRARGNPFWLTALATAEEQLHAPAELVAARLRGIGSDARHVLSAMAVLARPALLDDLARLVDWPSARVGPALSELVRRGVALEVNGLWRIAHDLIREAATAQVSDDLARSLHLRAARRLESDAHGDVVVLSRAIAHRRAAGRDVVALIGRIVASPNRRLVGSQGLHRLAGALARAARDPGTEKIEKGLARLAVELGEHDLALDLWRRLAERGASPRDRAWAALAACRAAFELQRADEARLLLDRVRGLASDDPWLALAVEAQEAFLLRWFEHRPDESAERSSTALSSARELLAAAGGAALDENARRTCCDVLEAAYEAAMVANDVAAMLALTEELAAAAHGFDEHLELRARVNHAQAIRMAISQREAEARARPLWEEARARSLPVVARGAGHGLAATLLALGRLDEAAALAGEVAALEHRIGQAAPGAQRARQLVLRIELARGDWHAAVAALERAAEEEGDPHYQLGYHELAMRATARFQGTDAAGQVRELRDRASREADAAACPRCSQQLALVSAEASARIGEPDRASALLRRASDHPDLMSLGAVRRLTEALLLADEHAAAAVGRLEELRRALVERGELYQELEVSVDLGRILAAVDRDAGIAELGRAAARAAEHGARTEQLLADRLLRSLGVRTWKPGRPTGGDDLLASLTPRERDVAALVASGASNPEIAQALFLSRKTVERHVSSAFAKLGVRNRTELATLLVER